MTRFVIGPDVALRLARENSKISGQHKFLAPTLFRSQVLSMVYAAVRDARMTEKAARTHLDYVRALPIRLLGDRVLQNLAWKIAKDLDWPDTLTAEYIALTHLQADGFVTLDMKLARAVERHVDVAPFKAILA